jgi:pyrroline-5-carboxylate reductase
MKDKKIAIIGCGNLGTAIAQGLALSDNVETTNITATRRRLKKIEHLQDKGIAIGTDNVKAVKNADIIIIAVEPQQVERVMAEIKDELCETQLLISVATGISLKALKEMSSGIPALFRAMPNTAIAYRESMTCMATEDSTEAQQELATQLFNELGQALIIRENLMASATVLAASGIAFALRYIRAAMQGGIEIGFDSETAQQVTAQTVKGAALILLEQGHHPEREVDKVTTPMGITISGLNEMEKQGFSSSLIQGLLASFNKIKKY